MLRCLYCIEVKMENIYEKNLQALQQNRPNLYEKLQQIKTNEKYEVFLNKKQRYANLYDTQKGVLFYENADNVVEAQKKEFEHYREYPFLYLYGIANGAVVEFLLQNKKLTQLIVIEPEIELIYIVLNLIDFSEDLQNNRLVILTQEEVTKSNIVILMHSSNAKYYIKVFKLLAVSSYYEKYYEEIYLETYKKFINTLRYVAEANGNDINDTFRGVKQHFENMDLMLSKYKYQDIRKKKNSNLAVIVSTGPSLSKQLPLLKQYQNRVTIISVDASFPILVQEGIVPDFVVSMERDEPTAKFFQVVDVKDQQNPIFLCASLQHKAVFEAIKGEKLALVMRPFEYNIYFGMDDYGYLCKGMSSANMAHELAYTMEFDQCVFIGQDLAFANDLTTHAQGHIFDSNELLDNVVKQKDFIEIEAYGGKGTVKTNRYWLIFKDFIEQLVEETSLVMKHYNATEGGARIHGTIEKSFKEVLQEYALDNEKKAIILDPIDIKEVTVSKEKVRKKLDDIIGESGALQQKVNEAFLKISEKTKKLENKSEAEMLVLLSVGETLELLNTISDIRKIIEESPIYTKFLASIIQPLLYNMELELAEIKVRYVDNPEDNQRKALQWILAHRFWLFSFSGTIENLLHIIQNSTLYQADHSE